MNRDFKVGDYVKVMDHDILGVLKIIRIGDQPSYMEFSSNETAIQVQEANEETFWIASNMLYFASRNSIMMHLLEN